MRPRTQSRAAAPGANWHVVTVAIQDRRSVVIRATVVTVMQLARHLTLSNFSNRLHSVVGRIGALSGWCPASEGEVQTGAGPRLRRKLGQCVAAVASTLIMLSTGPGIVTTMQRPLCLGMR